MGKPLPCNVLDVLPNLQASRGLPGLPGDLGLRPGSSRNKQVSRRRNVGPARAQGQRRGYSPPAGGTTWSSSFMLVRFQIFLMMARSSSLACSRFPVGGRGLTGSCPQGLWWAGLWRHLAPACPESRRCLHPEGPARCPPVGLWEEPERRACLPVHHARGPARREGTGSLGWSESAVAGLTLGVVVGGSVDR